MNNKQTEILLIQDGEFIGTDVRDVVDGPSLNNETCLESTGKQLCGRRVDGSYSYAIDMKKQHLSSIGQVKETGAWAAASEICVCRSTRQCIPSFQVPISTEDLDS